MVTKPMSDLCWVCQANTTAIMRSANLPEELKSAVSTYFFEIHTVVYLMCLLDYQEGRGTPAAGD